ncbi:maleylpyruvate isomerase family mycothiol-dependent enzyme [Actinomadura sp. 21ATH]|uniref:maleylpyruvate isomerase family mycothiol-dependent enzyme n=1 Tax=Actinomadura sp. 21ATH TaxID=1735444 RepID=UPI0035C22CD4
MTAAHGDVPSLLGAWAAGACPPGEAARVAEHLAECPSCMAESRALATATAFLGEPAGPPPPALRDRIMSAARSRRAPAPDVPDVPAFAAPYAAQVATLDALLAELAPADWSTTVIYDWTVQDVVAHLAAVDGLLHEQLGDEDPGPVGGEADVDARTASAIAYERARTPERTRTAWRSRSGALCERLAASGASPERQVRLRFRAPLDGAFIARAFETWVHTADIAAAVGRGVPDPLPRHLHAMADLGVRVLPVALAIRSGGGAEGAARVVLDGPGGGEWLVPLGGDGADAPPVVTLELGVMEFCLLAADRREPGAVRVDIGGDVALGRRLLESASAFAGP